MALSPNPKSSGKLSRDQVFEILERNAALYKNDDYFIHYFVDLAMYLIEYEYDWSESGAGQSPQAEIVPAQAETETPGESAKPRTVMLRSGIASEPVREKQVKFCPFCGNELGTNSVCPQCNNLAR